MGFIKNELNARAYARQVERARGLEKIRLLVRNEGISFVSGLTDNDSEPDLGLFAAYVCTMQRIFCDIFYSTMREHYDAMHMDDDRFDETASKIESNYHIQLLLGALWLGATLGIAICKAAIKNECMVNYDDVLGYIRNSKLEDDIKAQIIDGFTYTSEHISGEIPVDGSREIGALAQLFVGITPQKGHYADPFLFGGPIRQACLQVFRTIELGSLDIKALKELHFIG